MRITVTEHNVVTLLVEDPFGEEYVHAIGCKAMIDAVMTDLIFGGDDAIKAYVRQENEAQKRSAIRRVAGK